MVSYAIGALIALLLIGALGEMAVRTPHPALLALMPSTTWGRSSFVLRYAYWAALRTGRGHGGHCRRHLHGLLVPACAPVDMGGRVYCRR